ncbi:MAG: metallophosphoesterase, partial [Planctomycetota bacterium]|nr:metallophosphoesterase [Planctomycetota bacterium]
MVGNWPEVDLTAGAAVVGDLHLDVGDGGGAARFERWLEALDAPRLLVVGDLFDTWLGPASAREPGARRVIAALGAAGERGVGCAVVPGNRDFLLGADFEAASGC